MKLLLVCTLILGFGACSSNHESQKMILESEVYYVLQDTFLGNPLKCRILVRVPIASGSKKQVDDQLFVRFSLKNDTLRAESVVEGERGDEWILLKGKVVMEADTILFVAPNFSPVELDAELFNRTLYETEKRKILTLQVRRGTEQVLELLSAKTVQTAVGEPLRVK